MAVNFIEEFVGSLPPSGNYHSLVKVTPGALAPTYDVALPGLCYPQLAADPNGNAYVSGSPACAGPQFQPVNALQPIQKGAADAAVMKFSPEGSVVYATYLGGTGIDSAYAIAADRDGNAYITGATASLDFPTWLPYQPVNRGGSAWGSGDAFVTKLNPTGSALVYSTYLGGSGPDGGWGIEVDLEGNAYVVGEIGQTNNGQTDFPAQPVKSYCDAPDAFITKFDRTGSSLVYSACFGIYGMGLAITVDSSYFAYVLVYDELPSGCCSLHKLTDVPYVPSTIIDKDEDAVPDFADGFNLDPDDDDDDSNADEAFTPLMFQAWGVDLNVAQFKFSYAASDPAQVSIDSDEEFGAPDYLLPDDAGHLRIWKRDGNVSRNKNKLNAGGDYVAPSTATQSEVYSASQLGVDPTTRTATLYLEGIRQSKEHGDQEIKIEMDSDGSGPLPFLPLLSRKVTVNNAPERGDDEYFVGADGDITVSAPGVLANDPNNDDYDSAGPALTALLVNEPSNGTFSWNDNDDGSFTYTPPVGFLGDVTFTYRAYDSLKTSEKVTATLHVLPVVSVTASDAQASEEALNPGQFTFSRTGNTSAPLTVYYTVRDTAVSGGDYTALSGTFTIPAGSAAATLDLTPIQDSFAELSQTIEVVLLSDSTYLIGEAETALATLTDNDLGVIIAETEGNTEVDEAGITDTYTVSLNGEPEPGAVVTVTVTADSQVRVAQVGGPLPPTGPTFSNQITLTFTYLTWNVPQTVAVAAVSDAPAEGDHEGEITHSVTSGDPRFVGALSRALWRLWRMGLRRRSR